MARPKKEHLDYYPRTVIHISNREIRRLIFDYGAEGYLTYDYILEQIYGGKGYYIIVDSQLPFDIAYFLPVDINEEFVKKLIDSCIDYDLFNREKYETYKVLTSFSIQRNYLTAWRNKKEIIDELKIIEPKITKSDSKIIVFRDVKTNDVKNQNVALTRVFATKTPVNVSQTPINVAESAPKRGKMPQKKRKENKIKENKKGYKEIPLKNTDENSLNIKKNLTDTNRKNEKKEKEKSSDKKEKEIFEKCKQNYIGEFETYYWTSADEFHLRELLKKLQFTIEQGKFKTTLEKIFKDFLFYLPPFW